MTKEVMVTLSGLQLGDSGEDTVETVHIGEYYEKNGVHYLFFDELLEGHKTPIRNMLKLRNEKLEVRKRGPVSAELVFEDCRVPAANLVGIQKMLSKDRKGLSYDKRKEKETAAKEAFHKKGTCEKAGTQSAGRVVVSVRG